MILSQIVSSLFIILGITVGELIAVRAFGAVRNNYQRTLELMLLVSIFVIVSAEIKPGPAYTFILGFSTIIVTRGLSSALKYSAVKIENKINPPKEKEVTLSILIRNLKKYGHSEKEIEDILENTEFDSSFTKTMKNNVFDQQFRSKKK